MCGSCIMIELFALKHTKCIVCSRDSFCGHLLCNLQTAWKQKYFINSFDIFLILTQWVQWPKSLHKCDIVTWQFTDILCYYSVFITGMNSIIQQYTEKADSRSTTPQFSLHNQSMVTNQIICKIWEHYTKFVQHFD